MFKVTFVHSNIGILEEIILASPTHFGGGLRIYQPINAHKNMADNITDMFHSDHKVSLKSYVEVLNLASIGGIHKEDLENNNISRVVDELLNSNLLSENEKQSFFNKSVYSSDILVITPEGVMALIQWSEHLRKSSLTYKILEPVTRALWVVLGVIISLIFKYVDALFN